MMARQIYVLDLSDTALAAEYDAHHKPGGVPEQVLADIHASGVTAMEIYRFADRLVMVTETTGGSEPADRVASDSSQKWETLMDHFQRPLPDVALGTKWQEANKIFDLSEHNKGDDQP